MRNCSFRSNISISIALVVVLFAVVSEADFKKSGHKAVKAETPPVIDGDLADPIWLKAPWTDKFVQYQPNNGAPPTLKTSFAAAYDDEQLYFAVRCETNGRDSIVSRLTRRDRGGNYDNVTIVISPRNDDRTGYLFQVNPHGVKVDSAVSDDSAVDQSWDAIWRAETKIEETEWIIEIAIPLDQLRFVSGKKEWGFNVNRYIASLMESVDFSWVSLEENGWISNAGILSDVEEIPSKKPLSITPEAFVSWREETANYDGLGETGFGWGIGGYAKAGLSSDVILDLAINPDFGQVEVDDVILNLSAYETRFQEKRPFFLEGAGIYSTPIELFYSRRLGAAPPMPYMDGNETAVSGPASTNILAATKITGRTQGGVSFGVLDAVLMPTKFRLNNEDTGDFFNRESTPWTNATVFRLSEELTSRADVGILATAFNPNGTDGAYTSGLDWNFLSKERMYSFRGQVAGSYRSDDVLGTDASHGTNAYFKFAKEQGEHIRYNFTYQTVSPGFDPNDLGFLRRDDLHSWNGSLEILALRPKGPYQVMIFGINPDGQFNYDGDNLGQSVSSFGYIQWKNNLQTVLYGAIGAKHVDDRETRGGPLLKRPAWGVVGGDIVTDNRAMFGGSVGFSCGSMPLGYRISTEASLQIRLSRLQIDLGPGYTHIEGDEAYVSTSEDSDGNPLTIIGNRDLDQLDLRLSSTLVILRDLTFQTSAQMLLASADYSDYNLLFDDSSKTPVDRSDDFGDFSFTDLRIQALFRWEYLPGSAFYAVYTHAGNTFLFPNDPEISTTFRDIEDQEREHIFLIKLSHHFN